MKKIIISIVLLVLTIPGTGFSQDQTERNKERGKVNSLLHENLVRDDFKDTTMMYAFAFKVEVAKTPDGQSHVKKVDVSDSSAYKLYKDFDFLKEIRYELFMGQREEATFILPVAVFLSYPGKIEGLNYRHVVDNIQKLFFSTDDIESTTENYIYLPGLTGRTTTWVDY